ncbi:MAG: S8 family serine peptidase, partial [Clostridiales bacterium]|nr:S8 family serine peptidase [Clostridiales bacterium]
MRKTKKLLALFLVLALLFAAVPVFAQNEEERAFGGEPIWELPEYAGPLSAEEAYVRDTAAALSRPAGLQMDAKGSQIVTAIVWLTELPTALRPTYETMGINDPVYRQAAKQAADARKSIHGFAEQERDFSISAEYRHVFAGFAVVAPADRLALLAEMPGVYAITENKIRVSIPEDQTPDADEETLHELNYTPDPGYGVRGNRPTRQELGIGDLHAQGIDGTGVKVCVIDSGIRYTHPDLAGAYRGGYNYSFGVNMTDGDPMEGVYVGGSPNMDNPDGTHGTHCSGVVASQGISSLGMAPGCDFYMAQIFPAAYDSVIIACFEDITQDDEPGGHLPKMDVASCSWGYHDGTVQSGSAWSIEAYIINNATFTGMSVAIAAGNEADYAATILDLFSMPRDMFTLGTPSSSASFAVAVAATNLCADSSANTRMADYSSIGPVYQTSYIKPDITAPGTTIYSTLYSGNNGTYGTMSGTSMATPCIAGLLALLKQAHPDESPALLKARLMNSANPDRLTVSTRTKIKQSPYINTTSGVQPSVWEQGAGFPNIKKAIAAPNIITVTHRVPTGMLDESMRRGTMASFSFGDVMQGTTCTPITAQVNGNWTNYSVEYITRNPRYSRVAGTNVVPVITDNEDGSFTVALEIDAATTLGFYEGYIKVTVDGEVYTLPWGANVKAYTPPTCTHPNAYEDTDTVYIGSCMHYGHAADTWCPDCETYIAFGAVYKEKGPHIKPDAIEVPGTPVTCTANGTESNLLCGVCKQITTSGNPIVSLGQDEPQANHTAWVSVPAQTATCIQEGNEEGVRCTACGLDTATDLGLNATNHEDPIGVLVGDSAATCTAPGHEGNMMCTACESTENYISTG